MSTHLQEICCPASCGATSTRSNKPAQVFLGVEGLRVPGVRAQKRLGCATTVDHITEFAFNITVAKRHAIQILGWFSIRGRRNLEPSTHQSLQMLGYTQAAEHSVCWSIQYCQGPDASIGTCTARLRWCPRLWLFLWRGMMSLSVRAYAAVMISPTRSPDLR